MNLQSLITKRAGKGALGLGAAVLAGLFFYGGAPRLAASTPAAPPAAAVSATAPAASLPALSYADAVDRAAPAVVTIQVEKRVAVQPLAGLPGDDFLQRFFGDPRQFNGRNAPMPVERGLGSGVIVSADGDILTNNHVVEGADSVRVTLADGRDFTAKVVGTDPKTDLAVVHVDAKGLPVLALADSDRVRVGDVVLAVGNPLGVGQTVTMGIISAKGRTSGSADGAYEDFLQTDAPINQGNSGGALITVAGELIGINSQILSPSGGNIGIGFAIPSNMAKNVLTQLLATGHVRRGLLGVTVQSITSDLAQSLGLPSVHGALVSDVTADGPAARAGLRQGDVIVKINGAAVEDSNDLRNRVSSTAPGTNVTLDVRRDGADRSMDVRLGEVPADGTPANQPADDRDGGTLGLSVRPLTPNLADQYGVPRGVTGLVVTGVNPGGAAGRAGLQVGDVLRQVNGQPLRAEADLGKAVASRPDRPALVYAQRGDGVFYVAVPLAR
jgi:serine protease Do